MNILYLSTKKSWGGVVSLQVRTARELQKRGHRIFIISNRQSSLTRNAPTDIHLIARRTGMDYNPLLIIFLVRFIKKNNIQLIATNIKKEVIAGGMAARLCRIPSIRFIGNEKDVDDSRILQQWFIDKYVFPCRTTMELAQKKNPWLAEKDCRIIHIGHNRVFFASDQIASLRRHLGIPENSIVIGCTGRMVRSKGFGTLLDAFAELAGKRPHTYLVLTGEGRHKAEFMDLAKKLHLENRVIFAGFVSEPLLYAAMYDVAVLPSYYEAFPYAIVEYFSVGCAVVASDVGGVHEIITDGENGFIVPPHDSKQLCDRLLTLVDDPSLRLRLSRGALQAIEQKFSQDRMIDQFEDFFRESLQR